MIDFNLRWFDHGLLDLFGYESIPTEINKSVVKSYIYNSEHSSYTHSKDI